MTATFKVHHSFSQPDRSLFVFAGEIVQGVVHPGMSIRVPFNDSLTLELPINDIEFLQQTGGELTALTVLLEDPSDASLLEALGVADEFVVVSDGA